MPTTKGKLFQVALIYLVLTGPVMVLGGSALARPAFISPEYEEITNDDPREYAQTLITSRNNWCFTRPNLFLIDRDDDFVQVLAVCGNFDANDAEERSFRVTDFSDGTYAVEPWKSRVAGVPKAPLRRPPPCALRSELDVDLSTCVSEKLELLRLYFREEIESLDPFDLGGLPQREPLILLEQRFSNEFIQLLAGLAAFGPSGCYDYELGIYLGQKFDVDLTEPEMFKIVCLLSSRDDFEYAAFRLTLFPDYSFAVEPWDSRTESIPKPELRHKPYCKLSRLFPEIANNCSEDALEHFRPKREKWQGLRQIQ